MVVYFGGTLNTQDFPFKICRTVNLIAYTHPISSVRYGDDIPDSMIVLFATRPDYHVWSFRQIQTGTAFPRHMR